MVNEVMEADSHGQTLPETVKRLAKLKELNDAYNVSDEDFEVDTAPSKQI